MYSWVVRTASKGDNASRSDNVTRNKPIRFIMSFLLCNMHVKIDFTKTACGFEPLFDFPG
jgi:hypothetical protein